MRGRVALGGGGHGLDALVDAAHRAVEVPGRDRQHRLQRDVELAAEAAAAGRWARCARCSRGRPSTRATSSRSIIGAWVQAIDLHAVADALRQSRPPARCRRARRRRFRTCLRRVWRPAGALAASPHSTRPLGQDVVGLVGMERRRAGGQRRVDAVQRRQRLPGDRQVRGMHRLDRLARCRPAPARLAAIAHVALREHRLVLEVGIDAERIFARHIARREDAHDAGMARQGTARGRRW